MGRIVRAGVVAAVVVAAALGIWRFTRRDHRHEVKDEGAKSVGRGRGGGRRTVEAPGWFGQPGAPARRVAGRVTYHGAPVGGARVYLWSDLTEVGAIETPEVITAVDGTFDLGDQAAGTWTVTAEAPGKAAGGERLDLADPLARPDPARLELALGDCDVPIYGLVEDVSGGPIARAEIAASTISARARATAGDDGSYEICAARGASRLSARADGYATATLEVNAYGRTSKDFALAPAASLRGRAVRDDDGTPVAGALVQVDAPWVAYDATGRIPAWRERGLTGDDGGFTIDWIPPGRYLVTVTAAGLRSKEPSEALATVGTEDPPVECRLVPALRLSGLVRAGATPVAGVHVVTFIEGQMRDVTSQSDGTFAIDGLGEGQIHFTTWTANLIEPKVWNLTAADPRVELVVGSGGTIRGRVVRGGKPIAGAMVSAQGSEDGAGDRSGADGAFELRGLMPGSYDIYAESQDEGAFSKSKKATVTDGGTVEGVEVELDLAASIEGIVVDQKGAPVAEALVRFQLVDEGDMGFATTGKDGRFFAGCMSGGGDYTVTITTPRSPQPLPAPGGEPPERVFLRDGTSHVKGLRIVVERPSLAIAGKVVRASGAPVPDAMISVIESRPQPPTGPDYRWETVIAGRTSTDAEGAFAVGELLPGRYEVQVAAGDTKSHQDDIEAGRRDVVVSLPDPGRIEGSLAGFQTTPNVVARGRVDVGADSWFRRVTVSGDTFAISDARPGGYSICATTASEAACENLALAPGEIAHVSLHSPGTATLALRLVDARRRTPLPGRACSWSAVYGQESDAVITDQDGRASFEVPAGQNILIRCLPVAQGHEIGGSTNLNAVAGRTIERELRVVITEHELHMCDIGGMFMGDDYSLSHIRKGGPVDRAGLTHSDRLVALEGAPVAGVHPQALLFWICDRPDGATAPLTVDRGGEQRDVTIDVEPYHRDR